ncbi:MAG: hypothetical protein FWG68_07950 [Defluviitaleaceae bacterium]|nr:hypothetical protein [Defluviitaleaceae bacterium]
MKQERLKVLQMLEDGKITADDATKLLDTLHQSDTRAFINEDTAEQVEEKLQRFAKSAEHFAREFGQKASEAYKDVEPKIKKASQTMLEKTSEVIDEIAKTLHTTIENAKARAEENNKDSHDDDTPKPN